MKHYSSVYFWLKGMYFDKVHGFNTFEMTKYIKAMVNRQKVWSQ